MSSPYESKAKVVLDENGNPIVVFEKLNNFQKDNKGLLFEKLLLSLFPALYYSPMSVIVISSFFTELDLSAINVQKENWFFYYGILFCAFTNITSIILNLRICWCIYKKQRIFLIEEYFVWIERIGIILYFIIFLNAAGLGALIFLFVMSMVPFFPGLVPIVQFISSFLSNRAYFPSNETK